MRVGLNLLGFTPRQSGGIELYARRLIAALASRTPAGEEFVLFCNADNVAQFQAAVNELPGWSVLSINVGARPQAIRVLAEQLTLPVLARRARVDLLHSLSYTWPVAATCPGVVTVCDMLYALSPGAVPAAKRLYWRLAVPLSVKRCKRTITLSRDAKKDIVRLLKVPPEKVSVTYLAGYVEPPSEGVPQAAIKSTAEKYAGGFGRYVLTVGAMGHHKNLRTTIEALALLKTSEEFRDLRLVVAGLDYGVGAEIAGLIDHLGLRGTINLAGYVPQEELAALYAGASVYLSTSLMEGFGMTAVEAMSFGVPVVVGNRGALPEIVANGGVVVDALRPAEVADAVAQVLSNPIHARELSQAAMARAAEFSWSKTAEMTWAAYESVGAESSRRTDG